MEELWSNEEEGLVEELLGLREMEEYYYYTNTNDQDLMNIGDCHWNILEDFSFPFPTNTTSTSTTSACFQFHDHFSQPPSDIFSNTVIHSQIQTLDAGPPCKPKKLSSSGQPSKNLMAERRRRQRLNDRLSMLRSVVPKITKMDRTSILGDTIDYTKELIDSINKLQEEMKKLGSENDQLGLFTCIFKNDKPAQQTCSYIRNSPKFEVERRNSETRIEICCGANPGLLLSTVTTLEALGMDIEHCVISCFNDFQMQASCSHIHQDQERAALDSEEIKHALFSNAGYGGRCL